MVQKAQHSKASLTTLAPYEFVNCDLDSFLASGELAACPGAEAWPFHASAHSPLN